MNRSDFCDTRPILVIGSRAKAIATDLNDQFPVTIAHSRKEAIQHLVESPRLVVLCHTANSDTGLEFLAAAREASTLVIPPVLLVLETANKEILAQALALQCDDIIIGEVTPLELRMRVDLVLGKHQAREVLTREVDVLRERSERDPLTHLFNRRAFASHAKRELSKAQRNGQPLSLLVIDIDHFKAINDTHGHAVGDEVLIGFSERLQRQLRSYDLIGRHGGDELIVLLPDTDLKHAKRVCSKLLDAISTTPFPTRSGDTTVLATIGAATFTSAQRLPVGLVFDTLFETADGALYTAKKEGRARCHCLTMKPPAAAHASPSRQIGESS